MFYSVSTFLPFHLYVTILDYILCIFLFVIYEQVVILGHHLSCSMSSMQFTYFLSIKQIGTCYSQVLVLFNVAILYYTLFLKMHSIFSLILLLSPVLLCLLLRLPRSPLLLHTIQLYLLNLQHLQCRCILPCVVWHTVACILTSGWNPKGIQLWLSGIPPITSHFYSFSTLCIVIA